MKRSFFAIAALLVASQAGAQLATGNLQIDGKAGDVVTIKQPDVGFERKMDLKEDRYTFRRIPVGWYTVEVVHADGTAMQPAKVRVPVGTTTRVPVAVTEAKAASPSTDAADDNDK